MYRLISAGFFRESEGADVGYPLFFKEKSNCLYICETDNYNLILNFFMVPELNDYDIVNLDDGGYFSAGDLMPILIRDAAGRVSLFSYEECLNRLDELSKGKSPIFRYNLCSILGLEIDKQIENLERISGQYFSNTNNSASWLFIEHNSIHSDINFWSAAQKEKEDKSQYIMSVTGISDINDVLRWLMRPASISNRKWYDVWRIAKELMPQEKLIYGSAVRWISDKYNLLNSREFTDNQDFMEILFYIVEDGDDIEQVSDILEELLTEQPDTIPYFLRSVGSYRNLRRILSDVQAWDPLQAIDRFARLRGYVPS